MALLLPYEDRAVVCVLVQLPVAEPMMRPPRILCFFHGRGSATLLTQDTVFIALLCAALLANALGDNTSSPSGVGGSPTTTIQNGIVPTSGSGGDIVAATGNGRDKDASFEERLIVKTPDAADLAPVPDVVSRYREVEASEYEALAEVTVQGGKLVADGGKVTVTGEVTPRNEADAPEGAGGVEASKEGAQTAPEAAQTALEGAQTVLEGAETVSNTAEVAAKCEVGAPEAAEARPADEPGIQTRDADAPEGGFADTSASRKARPLRILFLNHLDWMSHHIWMSSLAVELARRGNLVHSLDVAKPRDVPPTLNATVLETAFDRHFDEMIRESKEGWIASQIRDIYRIGAMKCERDMSAPAVRRLIDKSFGGTFDVIVINVMSDCFLGFVQRFGYPPVVAAPPLPGAPWVDNLLGTPSLSGVVPLTLTHFPRPMGLWQRAATTAYVLYVKYLDAAYGPEFRRIARDAFGEEIDDFDELRKHVHLALVNESPVLDVARPLPPSVIPVGGMQIKPTNLTNIPQELLPWLDAADDGFIFVSFGSIVKSSHVDRTLVLALAEGFGALGRVRVLWKIEDGALADPPPNVRTSAWVPQNDLLGHPKLLLFVSHCGGLSTLEASHHGVPILGVPLFSDQFSNVHKMTCVGMARHLPFSDITRERLLAEVQEMLGNPKYREAARRIGVLMRDQKETPLERAVWWVEYLGRHRGAPHLRSPLLDAPWHQILLVDVFVVALLAALVVVLVPLLAVRWARWALVRPAKCLPCDSEAQQRRRLKED